MRKEGLTMDMDELGFLIFMDEIETEEEEDNQNTEEDE